MQDDRLVQDFLSDIAGLCGAIDRTGVAAIVDALIATWRRDGCVYVIGNGGSASTASHLVCDLCKYVAGDKKKPFNAVCLSDNIPLFTAWANDASFDDVYVRQIEQRIGPDDMLISFSVHGGSGFSGNLVKAMEFARDRGAFTVSFSGFDGGMLKEIADCSVIVPMDSTPHVEAMHVVLSHLVAARLREMLDQE